MPIGRLMVEDPHKEVAFDSVETEVVSMSFISYAQNCEDVVLWRALRDVAGGFYVDVGAADPSVDSVTKAFYERGWSGINIEPTEPYFSALQSQRSRDVNLRVLASAEAGVRPLYVIEGTGLSTLDEAFASRHADMGFKSRQLMVPQLTLNQLLESRSGLPIHFLKIDVEGTEAEVLSGIDLNVYRPWIVIVESTEPNCQNLTRHLWEHLLVDRGYELVYFDGLNCFYTASEQIHLKQKLAVPPNVFDDFLPVSQVRLQDDLVRQTLRAEALVDAQAASTTQIVRLESEIGGARDDLHTLSDGVLRLSRKYNSLLFSYNKTVNELSKLQASVHYILNRSLLEKIFLRVDGRPIKPLRLLLFHNSNKPRRLFRILVLRKSGKPRRAFSYWLNSSERDHLRQAEVTAPEALTTPRERYFLTRLAAFADGRRLKDL
jgi:FkbM family methyltransferase